MACWSTASLLTAPPPAVGIASALLRGVPLEEATVAVCRALPRADPDAGFTSALTELAEPRG